jgi:hypothetical protein
MNVENQNALASTEAKPMLDNGVIAGLDPAIHRLREDTFYEDDGCAGQARA